MKIVTIKELWLLHWCTKFHIDISSCFKPFMSYRGWKRWTSDTHAHTHIHPATPAKNHISRRFRLVALVIRNFFFSSRKQFPQWGSKMNNYYPFEIKDRTTFIQGVLNSFIWQSWPVKIRLIYVGWSKRVLLRRAFSRHPSNLRHR